MPKPISLAERILQASKQNTPPDQIDKEKEILSSLKTTVPAVQKPDQNSSILIIDENQNRLLDIGSGQDQVSGIRSRSDQGQVSSIRSGSGQDQVDPISTLYQPNIDTGSNKGQVKVEQRSGQDQVSGIRSRSDQHQVSSIRSGSGQGQVDIDETFILLAPQQQKIYLWFIKNGVKGYFNKGQIERESNVNHPTIRKVIRKLCNSNLIKLGDFDPVSRQQRYEINTKINVRLTQLDDGRVSSIRSRSTQGQVSSIGSGSGQGQVDTETPSNKLVSKFLNKLTNYIATSLLWSKENLSLKKCQEWIEEFYPTDPEMLLIQLMFAEKTETVLKPKTKTSTDVFYGCLLRGGLTRPKDFEFPEEKAAKIKQLEYESLQKALSEQESFRQKQKELADKQAFLNILNDKEAVDYYVSQILEEKFVTPATKNSIKLYRETGQIDSKLEKALERKFSMTDGG